MSDLFDTSKTLVNPIGGNQYNYHQSTYVYPTYSGPKEEQTLSALKPAERGGYYVPRCMEGTRQGVLTAIGGWLNDFSEPTFLLYERIPSQRSFCIEAPNVMWISGSPGSGKSAIASTLTSKLVAEQRLGSAFFFKRGDDNLGDPAALWRTVAFDLAHFNSAVEASLMEFLRGAAASLKDADVELHFERMVKGPLIHNYDKFGIPPVIVLDALDECGTDDSQFALRRLVLETLFLWSSLPPLFKLVVTSRDERVPSFFYDAQLETGHSASYETNGDIYLFFEKSLQYIRQDLCLPSRWPGSAAMNRMTGQAAGLFIWAKTAVAFIGEEKRGSPSAKLQLILDGKLGKETDSIDTLYRQILEFWFGNSDDHTLQLFRAVLGVIIFAKEPLRRDDPSFLLGRQDKENERQISVILQRLSSVIELDPLLRFRHPSFAEFLADAERCCDHRFLIDRNEQHWNLTSACLRIMETGLKFNICGLETSHIQNSDVTDLFDRVTTMIPTHLSYACRFWASHLCDTTTGKGDSHSQALLSAISDFFYTRLLYWLEVMSLIQQVSAASIALRTAAQWMKVGLDGFCFATHI